jgi:predicted ATP-grasp superfamily ATP-dependent carboligase
MISQQDNYAIICGTYINAYSICESLRKIQWPGKIACVAAGPREKTLVDLIKGVEVWHLAEPDDIIFEIQRRTPEHANKYVFFTSEQYHELFANLKPEMTDKIQYMLGSVDHLEIILDRYLFYQFIQEHKIFKVPITIPATENPGQYLGEKYFIRVRKSWHGLNRVRGVVMVPNQNDRDRLLNEYISKGLTIDDLCYQEALNLSVENNISVCGWHQINYHRYFCTRKAHQHPAILGNGDLVELCQPEEFLFNQTCKLLRLLNYCGPFEIEFIYDPIKMDYRIIELNPRFWMQHGLVEGLSGHELIRRYLGDDFAQIEISENDYKCWLNSFIALSRILKGEFRVVSYLNSPETYVAPDIATSIKWLPTYLLNKLKKL